MRANRILGLLTPILLIALCRAAIGHPMGNFSVNHYSKITLQGDRIRVHYLIDLAEIPAYQELQQANLQPNSIDPSSALVLTYIEHRGRELGQGLLLSLDGKPASLNLVASNVIFPPGAGGLPTMKMGFEYEARYPAASKAEIHPRSLHYTDTNYPGHSGWKEIVAVSSSGSLLSSSVPTTDRSRELANYPADLLTSPPQQLEASLVVDVPSRHDAIADSPIVSRTQKQPLSQTRFAASAAKEFAARPLRPSPIAHKAASSGSQPLAVNSGGLTLEASSQQTPRSKFTELIQEQNLSAWFLLTAAIIAIGLGGLHALEPGHGKTIVAAYLVGSRGTARHAALLGLIVTVSHTAGVFALGAITLYASRYIVPEQLYPWLGALSGITIAGLGGYMLLRRLTGTAADHSHAPGSSHSHWPFSKRTENGNELAVEAVQTVPSAQTAVSLAQLFTLGITGGIIPCPAALIVLLSAFALHRVGLGFFLIVAFSAGLAGVLIGFGMLMVYARRFMTHLQIDGPLTRRWLPVASSAFITVLGLVLTVQALSTVHFGPQMFTKEKLGPLLFVAGLGLILGMRHSTDADHVVAISTIVSKQKSIRSAAIIGSIWGLGHTITIFIVGSLIILFGVEIPPRLGLSMEFSVALMLILLGVLNLTGIMRKITAFFTPGETDRNTLAASARQARSNSTLDRVLQNSVGRFGLYQCLRPLVIGLVHGLAGSAAVALLVLSTIHNPVWATFYLLIFGAGTMLGMMVMTSAIAAPLSFAGERSKKLSQYFGVVSGMVSLCFGSFLVYQLGFLGGLFTSHPQWTPQ